MMIIDWSSRAQMPLHILLTKADKLKHGAAKAALLSAQKQLSQFGDHISLQLFSALKASGVVQLRKQLNAWLNPIEQL